MSICRKQPAPTISSKSASATEAEFEEALTDAINKHAIEHLVKGQFSHRAFDGVRAAHRRAVEAASEAGKQAVWEALTKVNDADLAEEHPEICESLHLMVKAHEGSARAEGKQNGIRITKEHVARYMEATFGRCNLLAVNGYLNGDDVAEEIRAEEFERRAAIPLDKPAE